MPQGIIQSHWQAPHPRRWQNEDEQNSHYVGLRIDCRIAGSVMSTPTRSLSVLIHMSEVWLDHDLLD